MYECVSKCVHILTAPRDGAAGDERADQWGARDHGTQSRAAVQTTAVSSTRHQGVSMSCDSHVISA